MFKGVFMTESYLTKIIREYQNKYAFLALNDYSWKKIENQILILLENHTIYVSKDIHNYLDKIMNNYIGNQIIKKNPRIIKNMLLLLFREYSNYSVLLQKFLEKIDELNINITEEYYQILKEQDALRKILIYLDCESLKFEELKDYLKKMMYYEKIRVYQKSFRVCKNIFESYFSLLDDECKNRILNHFDSYVGKFRYLIAQEDILEDIFGYCRDKYAKYPIEDFRMVIFSWNKERVDALIKEYRRNQCLVLENLKKYDYLLFLVQDVHRLNASGSDIKLFSFKEDIEEPKEPTSNYPKVRAGRVKRKTVYEYILPKDQPLTEKDKQIIDALFLNLSEERRENIQNYLNGLFLAKDELGKKARGDIYTIKRQFKIYRETGSLERKGKKKTIYEYFVIDGRDLTEEDKKIVDTLFSRLSAERRENIEKYLNGLFSSRSELGRKAIGYILTLQYQFKKYQEIGTLGKKSKKRTTIYEHFVVDGKSLSEEDKKIIDILFSRLSEERRENIQNYLNGLFSSRSELGKKVFVDIHILQQQFRRYKKTGILKFKERKKTIYEYFTIDGKDLTEEDKKIVDTLFSKLSAERRENIQNYLNDLFSTRDESDKKARSDIYILQQQFRRYKKTGTLDKKSKKRTTIYEHFVVDGKILSEEDKKIIDILFSKLSEERRENIQNYLNGLFPSNDKLGRKALNDIFVLQRKFKNYQETGTLERKGKKKTIYEYFVVDGKTLSEEDKKIIDILFSKLSEERRENIQNYLKGLFSSRSELGKKVFSDILILRQQFKKYQETGNLDFKKSVSVLGNEEKKIQEQFQNFRKVRLQKYQVLLEALKVVEESFYRLGYTFLEYQLYKQSKEQELISRGVLSDLDFLSSYISESALFIKEEQSKFSKN